MNLKELKNHQAMLLLVSKWNKFYNREDLMIILAILLTLFGILMFVRPSAIWLMTESWKSNDEAEPSDMYIWSTRFGGIMCFLAGLAGIYAYSI
jgi:hypothetical protein